MEIITFATTKLLESKYLREQSGSDAFGALRGVMVKVVLRIYIFIENIG